MGQNTFELLTLEAHLSILAGGPQLDLYPARSTRIDKLDKENRQH
jgi:hypothetical protein